MIQSAHAADAALDQPKALVVVVSRLLADIEQTQALATRLEVVSGRLMQQPPNPERDKKLTPTQPRPPEPFVPRINDLLTDLETELSKLNSSILHLERMV